MVPGLNHEINGPINDSVFGPANQSVERINMSVIQTATGVQLLLMFKNIRLFNRPECVV